jgi:hypothetical protein
MDPDAGALHGRPRVPGCQCLAEAVEPRDDRHGLGPLAGERRRVGWVEGHRRGLSADSMTGMVTVSDGPRT